MRIIGYLMIITSVLIGILGFLTIEYKRFNKILLFVWFAVFSTGVMLFSYSILNLIN